MTLQDITFEKKPEISNDYVCDFVATGAFNIHVERKRNGRFVMLQSLTGTGYVPFFTWNQLNSPECNFDMEVPNVPDGMNIRIISESEVTVAKIGYQS